MADRLPIDDVLPGLVRHLRQGPNAVLLAPPGAGKTTRVPGALVDEGLIAPDERVLVLEPRRLAARLAAQRIAAERGSRLGDEVGYQVRFEDRTSRRTRIAIVTEGILTRRLQSDPLLEGVGAVVLDEFHERSVHADLGLAFLREIQTTVRPELKVVVMSATLDPKPVQAFLGDCPVVESDGRQHPVEVRFLERPDERHPNDLMVSGVRRAVREVPEGDVLAFLPGAAEIRRVQADLQDKLSGVDVEALYGDLDPKAQDRAVASGPRRKVILATNIAESSLTIPGVRTVVDGGEHKINRFDPASGIDRLERVRISARSAAQRTGRAGRLGPGVAYRLWTEKEDRQLAREDQPEIRRVDLAPILLDVLRWSASDPAAFGWYEAPASAALERALRLLRQLEVVEEFRLTAQGERVAQVPLHPRLSVLLAAAHAAGRLRQGALLAAVASERDVIPRARPGEGETDEVGDSDLMLRVERLEGYAAGGGRAGAWGLAGGAADNALKVARRLEQLAGRVFERPSSATSTAPGQWVLAAFPDRLGRRRRTGEAKVTLGGGGGARLAPESVVKEAELLVAVRIDGVGRGRGEPWIRLASAVERDWITVRTYHSARWAGTRAEAVIERRAGDLVLETRPDPHPDPEALARVLEEAAAADLDRAVPRTDAFELFLRRYRLVQVHLPDLELPPMDASVRRQMLPELCLGLKSFGELQRIDLVARLLARLPRSAQSAIAKEAPTSVPIPSGRQAKLRYEPDGPPVLSVRLQEVFGLYDTPRVAGGRVPVKMELLAPNQRPVQVTQDLASFWQNTYAEVRKELRRRYPKHQWPEDPKDGIASRRVRPRKR